MLFNNFLCEACEGSYVTQYRLILLDNRITNGPAPFIYESNLAEKENRDKF